jgi:hypothetical protein
VPATKFQNPTPASRIYYAQTTPAALAGIGSVFNLRQAWVPPGQDAAPQVRTVALADAWNQGGLFLFLGSTLADEDSFVARLAVLMRQPQFVTARVMWIANPNDREDQWQTWNIRVSRKADGTSRVGAVARFDFLNYAFMIAGGSIQARESSFEIDAPDAASIFLTVEDGAVRLSVVPHGPVIISYEDSPGCLTFPVEGGISFFDDLDVSCRLFFANEGAIDSIRQPIFAPAATVSLSATLDPFAPLDPSRTAFAFQPGQAIGSYFRTNAGKPITLTPMAGSRLQLAFLAELPPPAPAVKYYLVPDGSFGIQGPGTPPRLLCGIFGAEFIELTGDSILTFEAGQPAFIPAFDPKQPLPPGDGDVIFALTRQATTAWVTVHSPTATLCYSAVPDGAGFFRPAAAGDLTLLEYYGACSAFLPESGAPPYPLLPYAGVEAQDLAATFTIEQRVLAPLRRHIIRDNQAVTPVPPTTGDNADVHVVTPQGLVAQFSSDRTQWKTLTVGGSESGPFRLTTIGDPLRSALLTNQQFVVISDPAALAPHFETGHNTIQMEGWRFTLDQAGWQRYGTIAIVKNSPRPLRELVADLNSWTLAADFNETPARTRQQLLDILDEADAQSSNVDLEYFAKTVAADPGWNGVLFLNVPLTAFPDSFQGLSGAVKPSGLFAHHVGFNQTPIAKTVTAQDSQTSSLFGLLHYTDDTVATGSADFEFQVTLLGVVFRNSAVRHLAAKAALYVRALFGSAVKADSRAPLRLKGTIETHGTAKVFAMVSDEGPRTIKLDDSVLTGVRIANTHFATKTVPDDGTAPVTSRFDFWGGLQFAVLPGSQGPFDLFSYDDLSFSKLGANMATTANGQTFTFDPFAMTFDASTSLLRQPGSMVSQFPVQLKAFTFSDEKTTPTGAGYLAIALSQVGVAPVTPPWYGLVFNLNLGTLGTLAADAGLVATFAAIWSPGRGAPRAFAGIHLPGLTGGQNQVSLMGVVKVAMHSVELVRQGSDFVLLLDGIALKFLGKSLPPGGSFDFYLFGNQPGSPGANQLAWYGAYLKGP